MADQGRGATKEYIREDHVNDGPQTLTAQKGADAGGRGVNVPWYCPACGAQSSGRGNEPHCGTSPSVEGTKYSG